VRLDELAAGRSGSGRFYGCDVVSASDAPSARGLECVECRRVSRDSERGWTAYVTAEDGGSEGVAILCDRGAEQEFGSSSCC
jgi:hypothetical protein